MAEDEGGGKGGAELEEAIDLPGLREIHSVDLAADEHFVFVVGRLTDGRAVRLPMAVGVAMQLLAVLAEIRKDLGIALDSRAVEKDIVQ